MKKTQSITELMIRDHKRLKTLFNEFKKLKARKSKKACELFARFDSELRKHFAVEEKIMTSVFSKKRGNKEGSLLPISRALRLEHDEVRGILENISTSIRNNGSVIDTYDMHLILRRHESIEERLFYPELDAMLSEKEKCHIFNKIKE